jgi:flagellar hook-associated protein 3
MRVTQGLLFQQALDGVRLHEEAVAKSQNQISTGKRFQRISEDPTAGAESLRYHSRSDALARFQTILADGQDRLNASASGLQDLSGILSEVKETATYAGNPTLTATDRAALADKLDALLGQVMDVANRKDGFGFLFGGTATGQPYALNGSKVQYQGNDGVQSITAGDSYTLDTNIPGSAIFSKQARTTTLYFGGGTGVKAGTGTDSGLDRGALLVTHGATTLGDGALAGGDSVSGVKLAATSAASDTVIGNVGTHVLHIDDVNKTISLNGGAAVAYTGSETDLAVDDGTGALVHVDVSALTSGFVGDVSVAATGFLSTDGGATQAAITFSGNQVLVDSADGNTTNVNSQGIRKAGSETIDYAGTSDLFQAIVGLRDDLRNYDKLPASVRDASIQARAREAGRNLEVVLGSVSVLGSRAKSAGDAVARTQQMRDDADGKISTLEDTDFAEAVVSYNKSQIALQLAQEAGSRLLNTNYLAFLQ